MDLISVIVPIYKVENYLNKCIESIVNQTYRNLEIILVDDGSPDNSPAMCDEWAKKDKRIKVIHKENGGVSSARNSGLQKASGIYIGFVDGDDYIKFDMYEKLVANIKLSNCDVVICGNYFVSQDYTILNNNSYMNKIIETEPGIIPYATNEKFEVCCVWNKLYLMSEIKKNKIEFNENISVGEDFLFNYFYLKYTKKISIINDILYYYVIGRQDSQTENLSEASVNRWKVYKIVLENEKENNNVYRHCLSVYFDQLLIGLKQLLSSQNTYMINNFYKVIVNEIKAYYNSFINKCGLKNRKN